MTIDYDGVSYTTPLQTTSGTYSFFKGNISVEIATITITAYNTPLVVSTLVKCPFQEEMTIIQVVLNNNSETGLSTTTQFNYTYGLYTSPLQSNSLVFLGGPTTPVVSNYNVSTGFVGAGIFPPEGANMRIANNQIFPDTYVFNPADDNFRYLRSNTIYGASIPEITALLAASTEATPLVNSLTSWYADFIVPNNTLGNILYLIWDYRKPTAINLCYSDAEATDPLLDSCCLCEPCNTPCVTYLVSNPSATETTEVSFPGGLCETPNVGFNLELEPGDEPEMLNIYVQGYAVPFTVLSGEATVVTISCG